MTDPPTSPIPGVAVAAAPGTDGEVLTRAAGVEELGEIPGSGYRQAPALVRRGDGQVLTLTPLLQQVFTAIDGHRTVAEVAEQVSASYGRAVRPDDVRHLVDQSLRPLGLLRTADGREPEVRRADPLLALRFRKVATDPAVTRRLTAPFAVLFHPLIVVPVVLAFVAVAANANVAAPIDASVAANVGSVDSVATSIAQQDAIITQDLDANAEATADQTSTITQ